MKVLLSYARSTFWTVAVVTVLFGLSVLVTAALQARSRPVSAIVGTCLGLFITTAGTVTGLAARALRRQGRFAKTLVRICQYLQLAHLPFWNSRCGGRDLLVFLA